MEKDVNLQPDGINYQKQAAGKLQDRNRSEVLLEKIPRAQAIFKNEQKELYQAKKIPYCTANTTTEQKKKFGNYALDKGLISKIQEELKKLNNNNKTQVIQ